MTPLAYSVVGLCLALTVVNLLLTLGIIRKLASKPSSAPAVMIPALSVGSRVPSRAADELGLADSDTGALVAFVAGDCEGCHAQAGDLAAFVSENPQLRRVVVVSTLMHKGGTPSDVPLPLDERLLTIEEPLDGPWQADFQVTDFPTFFLVRQGRVGAAGHHIRRLPAGVV